MLQDIIKGCFLSNILNNATGEEIEKIKDKQNKNTRNRLMITSSIFILMEGFYLITDLINGFYQIDRTNLLNLAAVLIMLISSILILVYTLTLGKKPDRGVQLITFFYYLLIELGMMLFLASELIKNHQQYILVYFNLVVLVISTIYIWQLLAIAQGALILGVIINMALLFKAGQPWAFNQTIIILLGAVILSHYLRIVKTKAMYQQLRLEEISKKFEYISTIDFLTGLSNRTALDNYLKNEVNEAMMKNYNISLTMLDIDDFKAYNDHYSHMTGDVCLKEIGGELNKLNNDKFHAFRYGGEEFLVLGINPTNDELNDLNMAILTSVRGLRIDRREVKSVKDYVTVSLGSARGLCHNLADFMNLLKLADNRLYESKKTGKNKCTSQ